MAAMTAAFPFKARSMMSALPRGQSRTWSPTRYSTPATRTTPSAGRSTVGSQRSLSMDRPPRGRMESPERPVQPQELLARHRLGPFQQRAAAGVERGHRTLLVVGQGHDPEREDLVDLGRVEEVAG